MVPAQPTLSPAVVLLDELTQRITGFAGLANRIDLVVLPASPLPPGVAVVPDVATLDLKTDDAGALDRHNEVDLMIFEVVGDTLARESPRCLVGAVRQGFDRPCARPRWPGGAFPRRANVTAAALA